jgi:hypothetical protein
VQPDREAGVAPRELHGFRGRPFAHHQARRGEHALAVGPLHRLVDLGRKAEIVGGDDDPAQPYAAAFWDDCDRSRRKRKNSTPSRSRRTSICRSRTISPQMEAIFGARK